MHGHSVFLFLQSILDLLNGNLVAFMEGYLQPASQSPGFFKH
jgi:hypothetical protein